MIETLLEPKLRLTVPAWVLYNRPNLLSLFRRACTNNNKDLRRFARPVAQPPHRPTQLTLASARAVAVLHVDFEVVQHELVNLIDERHPAQVVEVPLELVVQVFAPLVEVVLRVSLKPLVFAGDEERHAALDVGGAVVEGDAQTPDVGVARRAEPLAQVWEGAVAAHHVEGVLGEVVVHCFVAELLGDQEELCFGARWGFWRRFVGYMGRRRTGSVPVFDDVRETDVVVGGFGAVADVNVSRVDEVFEDLESELCWQCHEGCVAR